MVLEFAVPVTATVVSSHRCSTFSQEVGTRTPLAFVSPEESSTALIISTLQVALSFDQSLHQGWSAARVPRTIGQISGPGNARRSSSTEAYPGSELRPYGSCFMDLTNPANQGD